MKLIFTDLDGTLLDHHDYSFAQASEALQLVKETKTPLIINTSKTKAEVKILREELQCKDPFIVENGAGVFFPKSFQDNSIQDYEDYKVLILGKQRDEILQEVQNFREDFNFTGFENCSIEEVMELTDLDYESASNAKKRDFTEPFIIEDRERIEDLKSLIDNSIDITEGGRFFHFISKEQDKGKALLKTKEIYERIYKEKITTIALGDGKNDYAMLAVADIPVLIPKPNGEYENQEIKNHIKAPFPGPKGWNKVIKEILSE